MFALNLYILSVIPVKILGLSTFYNRKAITVDEVVNQEKEGC